MLVPDDIAQLPGAGESAQTRRSFKKRYALALLRQAKRKRHAEESASDDCPVFRVGRTHKVRQSELRLRNDSGLHSVFPLARGAHIRAVTHGGAICGVA